jgi:hypothetical protein
MFLAIRADIAQGTIPRSSVCRAAFGTTAPCWLPVFATRQYCSRYVTGQDQAGCMPPYIDPAAIVFVNLTERTKFRHHNGGVGLNVSW